MPGHSELDFLMQPDASKHQQVYVQLREAILRNDFPAGTVMVERKLCELYGVSRSPIRNALHQLTFEGLLAYQPGKGTVVPDITLEDILEIYDLLEVLQIYAAKVCVRKMDAASQTAIQDIIEHMHQSLMEQDVHQTAKWDQQLHEFIVKRAGNHRLEVFFAQLQNNQARLIARTLKDGPLYEQTYMEHREICSHLVARDYEGVENAIRRHYENLRKYYIDLLIYKRAQPN